MRLFSRGAAAGTALLLAAGLTGCAPFGGGSGSAVSGGGRAEGPLGEAGVDRPGKPIAQGTFDTPIAEGAKLDIAVLGLRARGRLATLSVQFTPRIPAGGPTRINPYRLNGEHGLGTSLIDPVNLKRYVVVRDSGNKELQTDDIFTKLVDGQPTHLYYTFAAPPEDVKAVDVQIGSWPTFRNIPVER